VVSLATHQTELDDNVAVAVSLIDETHLAGRLSVISREARGLAIVLLFAAYENLLKTLTRTLLETAASLRVGNRRLQPGFRAFALAAAVDSVRNISPRKMYVKALPELVRIADPGGRVCTINTSAFPDDGSFMRQSQIKVWCATFNVPAPNRILSRIWTDIDTVVARRNAIAHGKRTPGDVGREYTEAEIRSLIDRWRDDWTNFISTVETLATQRDFFRIP
jgi:hypothetical protein